MAVQGDEVEQRNGALLGGSSHDLDTWLVTMVIVSPLTRVVGALPNGRFMAYKWGLLTILTDWDDPPSGKQLFSPLWQFGHPWRWLVPFFVKMGYWYGLRTLTFSLTTIILTKTQTKQTNKQTKKPTRQPTTTTTTTSTKPARSPPRLLHSSQPPPRSSRPAAAFVEAVSKKVIW